MNASDQLAVTFSPKALADGLRAIYNREVNVTTEIERHIFEETLRRFNLATAKGLSESIDPEVITDRFLYELRTNNAVFSAFKTHRMQNDIAAQLIDPVTGQLKSFDRWKLDIKGMTDHYCIQWLQTEYDTAVIRAHQAADWKHFVEEADVFPNVRWMQTTSIVPDPLHERYWSKKLTLPVNHPFWQEHRPGDRWNCKCSLQQTDEPVNAEALDGYTPPLPMPGLDNNPAKDGKLFSDTHPYITDAYPGADLAVKKSLNVDPGWIPAETITDAEDFATRYVKQIGLDRTFKGKVSYKGIDLTMANEINHTLAQAFEQLDMPKISGIKAISGSSATGKKIFKSGESIAAYDPIQKGIFLNSDILGSPEKLEAYLKRSREAFDLVKKNLDKLPPAKRAIAERYIKAGRELTDDSLQGMILHELGHHVQWNVVPTKLFNELGDNWETIAARISGYAGTSKSEYLAESFVSWMRGEKLIDPRLKSFFDSKLKAVPQVQKVLKRSPSRMRRTEEEKERILKEWEERKALRENDIKLAKKLGISPPQIEMSFEAANNHAVNPIYTKLSTKKAELIGKTQNCQTCVVAYEMRRRGFNVEASLWKKTDQGSFKGFLAKHPGQAFVLPGAKYDPKYGWGPRATVAQTINDVIEKKLSPGRYHIHWEWSKTPDAHVITFEIDKKGMIQFYDPQCGERYSPEEFYNKYNSSIKENSIHYYRVDDLPFDTRVADIVIKK